MKLCWPIAWYNKQRLVDEVNRLNARVEQLVAQRHLVDATLVRVETERLKLERDEEKKGRQAEKSYRLDIEAEFRQEIALLQEQVRAAQKEGDEHWFKAKQERDAARAAVDLGVSLLLAADAGAAAAELDKRRTWLEKDEATR